MENKQTNHRKIKIIAGIFAIALVAALLYWLFTSLLNTNQHSQTKQEPSRTANYQMDDENTSPQQPSTNSKSNLDNNRTNQPNKDTEVSSNSSTKTTVDNTAAVRRSSAASQYPKAILASKKPPTSSSIFQKPKRKPITKPGGSKPTTPPSTPKPTPEPAQAAVKIVGAPEVGSTLIAQIDDPDGLKDGGIRYYQWSADGAAIPGASYFSYKLTPAEVGKKITVKTTHANNKNVMKDLISSATAAVGNAASNNNHGSVTIDGINRVGQVFTARITDADGVPESGITYRWYEFYGKFLGTGKTLAQTKDHLGMQVIVQASYTDKKGHKESVTSGFSGSVVDNSGGGTGAGIISPAATAPKITLHGPASVKEGETAVLHDNFRQSSQHRC